MTTAPPAETPTDLPCHRCGYDLRAHPLDGKCPECEASVAESKRLAAIPLRPTWRNSDPRWRRRIIAGAWLLVLLPLMDVLEAFRCTSRVPVPPVFSQGAERTLNDTFLYSMSVYQPLMFCMGVVLLFSKERGRRRHRFDWTRRWGILCSYVMLLLSAVPILFISALVWVGVSMLFVRMPLKYQPHVTPLLIKVSTTYLRYGPHPRDFSEVVRAAFASITILLACFTLFEALRRTVSKALAAILLAPLALFSLMNLMMVASCCLRLSSLTPGAFVDYGLYFRPQVFATFVATLPSGVDVWASLSNGFFMEAAKWCIVLTIAIWLTLARFAGAWQRGNTKPR